MGLSYLRVLSDQRQQQVAGGSRDASANFQFSEEQSSLSKTRVESNRFIQSTLSSFDCPPAVHQGRAFCKLQIGNCQLVPDVRIFAVDVAERFKFADRCVRIEGGSLSSGVALARAIG